MAEGRPVHPAGACRGRACPGPRQTCRNLQDGRGRAPPLRTRRDRRTTRRGRACPGPCQTCRNLQDGRGRAPPLRTRRDRRTTRRGRACPGPCQTCRNLQDGRGRAPPLRTRRDRRTTRRGRACPGPRQTCRNRKTGGDEPRPYELVATGARRVGAGLVPARARPAAIARRAGTSPAPTKSSRPEHDARRGRACPGPRQTCRNRRTGGDEPRPYELVATGGRRVGAGLVPARARPAAICRTGGDEPRPYELVATGGRRVGAGLVPARARPGGIYARASRRWRNVLGRPRDGRRVPGDRGADGVLRAGLNPPPAGP